MQLTYTTTGTRRLGAVEAELYTALLALVSHPFTTGVDYEANPAPLQESDDEIVESDAQPFTWAVWLLDNSTPTDILGAGDVLSEALQEAIDTLRTWEANR
jgi:hypothetical protein